MRFLSFAVVAVLAASCAARKIPGTDIDDTSDTRAVIDLVDKYRLAVEEKNSQAIVGMVDETFRDDGGTSSPDDDLDYRRLKDSLTQRFSRMDDVKLDMSVRKVEFDEAADNARVTYTYTVSFKLPGLTSRTQSETDIKQMLLKRGDKQSAWRIVSGI